MKEALNAARWNDLAARLGLGKPLMVFRWLESRYQQPARKYHTARHVNECLGVLDRTNHPEATNRYAEFELQIRAEYWWVPTAMYRKQRAVVLNSFVRRSSVYSTHEFRERFERQARNNLAWGLEQLEFGRATFRWTARF